jgi:hypothetical protein
MMVATAPEARTGRRQPGWSRLRRTGLVLLLAAGVQFGAAAPASAHAVGSGPAASNYRTNVHGIDPPIPGVTVRTVDGGNRLELINRGAREITLLGYQNEPYLRVGPSGVFENEHSPSTFSNRSTIAPTQIPPQFSADAQPDWRRVSSRPVAIFHDHRAHWAGGPDPAAVRRDRGKRQLVSPNWQVPIKVGDQTSILSGDIEWVPGPSPWPWAALAAALAALVLLVGRIGRQARVLAGVTALAVVADAVHTYGVWTGSTAPILTLVYGSATSFAGWVVAAIAIQRLLTGKLEAGRTFMLLAAIFLALAGAAPDVPALARSQLPSGLDPLLARAAISATLGLGTGMLLVALLGRQLRAAGAPVAGGARRPRPPGAQPRRGNGGMAQAGAPRQGGQGGAGSPPRKRGSPGGSGGGKKRSRKSGGR